MTSVRNGYEQIFKPTPVLSLSIFIGILVLVILQTLPAFSQRLSGGGDLGGGAGYTTWNGSLVAPSALQAPQNNSVPNDRPEEAISLALNYHETLRRSFDPFTFQKIREAISERNYRKTDSMPPDVHRQLQAEYDALSSRNLFPHSYRFVAYTQNSITYILPDWNRLSQFDKVIMLYHEAFYALIRGPRLTDVIAFETAVRQVILNPQDVEKAAELTSSFYSKFLPRNDILPFLINTYNMYGVRILVSDLIDQEHQSFLMESAASFDQNCLNTGRGIPASSISRVRNLGSLIGEFSTIQKLQQKAPFLASYLFRDGNFRRVHFTFETRYFPRLGFLNEGSWLYTPIECEYKNYDYSNFEVKMQMDQTPARQSENGLILPRNLSDSVVMAVAVPRDPTLKPTPSGWTNYVSSSLRAKRSLPENRNLSESELIRKYFFVQPPVFSLSTN